jgi:hypothetical protein
MVAPWDAAARIDQDPLELWVAIWSENDTHL